MEVTRTPMNLRFYAGEALRATGATFPAPGSTTIYTVREPIGIVGAITPWNFPLNIPSRKLGPALAAGNTVLFKPSEITPLMGSDSSRPCSPVVCRPARSHSSRATARQARPCPATNGSRP